MKNEGLTLEAVALASFMVFAGADAVHTVPERPLIETTTVRGFKNCDRGSVAYGVENTCDGKFNTFGSESNGLRESRDPLPEEYDTNPLDPESKIMPALDIRKYNNGEIWRSPASEGKPYNMAVIP